LQGGAADTKNCGARAPAGPAMISFTQARGRITNALRHSATPGLRRLRIGA